MATKNDTRSLPDYGFRGFGPELRSPVDLLGKLQHDLNRLLAAPTSTYAAFDFFVTANCMVDWVWPSATNKGEIRAEHPLTRICEHLRTARNTSC